LAIPTLCFESDRRKGKFGDPSSHENIDVDGFVRFVEGEESCRSFINEAIAPKLAESANVSGQAKSVDVSGRSHFDAECVDIELDPDRHWRLAVREDVADSFF